MTLSMEQLRREHARIQARMASVAKIEEWDAERRVHEIDAAKCKAELERLTREYTAKIGAMMASADALRIKIRDEKAKYNKKVWIVLRVSSRNDTILEVPRVFFETEEAANNYVARVSSGGYQIHCMEVVDE